jgi:tetratricopeptide (TPR) repeat protein
MGEQVAVLKHEGFADALWQGILMSEKGLVLDPTDIGSWTVLTRFYHSLSLSQLAKEASDSAFKINPDDQAMLAERIAALVDAGSAQEAFDTIERMSGQQSDPWLSTVKAELLKREGRSAEALACMGVAPSTAWDLEWFLFVRAECQVDLGHLDAAVSDLEAMLGLDVSLTGDEASRRAYALAVLGRQDEAAQLLARTLTRETPDPNARALAESAIALSNGEVERAFRELTSSLRTSQDRITAEETLAALGRAVVLLEFAGRSFAAADGLMDEARRSLREMAPRVADADSELEFALAQFAAAPDDSPEVVALVATKARRLLERSLLDEAAQLYRKLMGTPFEPHAGQAAAHALERAFQEAVQRGQLDETRDLFDRLAQLGHPPTSDVDLALAQALRQRGDYSEEVAILLPMVQSVKEPEERLSVLELLGEGALLSGQADVAVQVLDEAYELAAGTADSSRAAHIAVRQAVAKATVGDLGSSARYLVLAFGQLAKAGVWDPQVILRLEMEWLTSTLPAETRQSLTNLLESALRLATARSPQAQDDPSEP